jgi:hypothetical protein
MSSLLSWWSSTGGVAPQAGVVAPQAGVVAPQAGVVGQQGFPPLPQFEENVPDDELEFYGKLRRWPRAMLASPNVPRYHSIDCCQRCVML